MIPRSIKLRNFLSYREDAVTFTGLHVAVLSGKNGEGKSSLLDGITWALWGEARGRLEDDRIHLGEREMLVDLEFEANGHVYRVVRKRTRTRSGSLELFQVREDGRQAPLTGGTIRDTQAEIDRRVGMDYLTFVNSAFIAQGRADEFTRKSPSDRKDVLRRVLGLERYEELSKRARERRSSDQVDLAAQERWLSDATMEVATLPEVESDLSAAKAEAEALAPVLSRAEGAVRELAVAANDRAGRQRAVDELASQATRLRATVQAAEKALTEANNGLAAARAIMGDAEEVTRRFDELTAAREVEAVLARKASDARSFESEIARLTTILAREEAMLTSRRDEATRRLESLREVASTLDELVAKERALAEERAGLARMDEAIEGHRQCAAAKRAEAAEQQSRAEQAKARARELKTDEGRLAGAERLCPVCQQPLSEHDAARLVEESRAERKRLGELHGELVASVARLTAEAEEAEQHAAEAIKAKAACEEELRSRERVLHGRIEQARAAADEAEKLEAIAAAAATALAEESFATEERAALFLVRSRLEEVGYQEPDHVAARERVQALAGADEAFRELRLAEERAGALEDRIERERKALAEARDSLVEVEAKLGEAREALAATEDVTERLSEAETALSELRGQQQALAGRQGALAERVKLLQRRAAEVEAARDRIVAAQEDVQLNGELVDAFGRNGVQAMLIDQAIPEIERVANDMLERMTGGRIEVRLSTRRQSASGAHRDTLDILIADDLGVRDYEMYSGGESFRVDFALRIALSHVLAARAGATLPTLIIDEGFGTQDSEGIDRLVDSINAIQQDYRLILIVTHLDELKERFERRIEVTKDPRLGSRAVVS